MDINLVDQIKMAVKNIKLSLINPATAYFFEEYVEYLNQPLLLDPKTSTCGAV